ncbi:MAG: von Willebrand factor type A domain-containing protein [Cyclobacteriaceae bacterium]|nr:von Willebrand factor type A domain-containing protein [Cyclobacteriaceae bacterium]
MKRLSVLIMILMLGMACTTEAKERKISGKVISAEDASALPGVNVVIKGTTNGTITDVNGAYEIIVPDQGGVLIFSFVGLITEEVTIGEKTIINVAMSADVAQLSEIVVTGYSRKNKRVAKEAKPMYAPTYEYEKSEVAQNQLIISDFDQEEFNTEEYDAIHENSFLEATKNPLSTFSIDVDAASYSNVRRFLNNGQMPPKDAVRIEEMVNYFNYDYEQPTGDIPFSVNTEISTAPWNDKHKLVHIGLQGKNIPTDNLPPSNLVFLIDVSGSMSSTNKLPLLKAGYKLLVGQLRPQDNVAIVVYAGAAGLVLPSTSGKNKNAILNALNKLQSGGSTAGGAGIKLAYKVAKENFKPEGNNRVILATDGDFNIGESSNAGMERLIEQKREEGVFLTVLGFGMGNYKDSKMETIADKGNGNYAYIDNILEAKKVLVNEFGGTLFTIAKDVKLQIEFNPAKVQSYRLIGYENRALRNEDFNNDKKDAGELGSGHTVTAMYEIIPVGVKSKFNPIDELKYQKTEIDPKSINSNELMTVKLRYKQPNGSKSKLIEHPLLDEQIDLDNTSNNFRWAAAVAEWGMLLRDSEFKGDANFDQVLQLAKNAKGKDKQGYRIELINLVESCQIMAKK